MKAFHNDPDLKERVLAQLEAHYDADEIIHGVYWENGKGCAVGCTVHSNLHKDYETELGIPEVLAYVEEFIFEELPNDVAKEWPLRFIKAIPVGADLSKVWPQLTVFLLEGVLRYAETDEQKDIIKHVADLYSAEKEVPKKEWDNARKEAQRIYDATTSGRVYNSVYAAVQAANYYDTPDAACFIINAACCAITAQVFSTISVIFFRGDYKKKCYNDCYCFLADKLIDLLSACKNN